VEPQTTSARGPGRASVATEVRRRVIAGGERHWTHADLGDLPAGAVAHALSRLATAGELRRIRKGLYYRAKETVLGPSLPSATAALASTFSAPLHPSGLTAANVLGLTTQNPAHGEFATPAAAGPGVLSGATVHTRRPHARYELGNEDGALLELLRDRARTSDLEPRETIQRLVSRLADPGRFARLARAALSEPPRVRAMLGALGELADQDTSELRASLNPLSRFDFGPLTALPNARSWQAK
jgi:predicted transcriptional regulator of viral defense system